jgi:hypothetical protein
MGEFRTVYKFGPENRNGRGILEVDLDMGIILK